MEIIGDGYKFKIALVSISATNGEGLENLNSDFKGIKDMFVSYLVSEMNNNKELNNGHADNWLGDFDEEIYMYHGCDGFDIEYEITRVEGCGDWDIICEGGKWGIAKNI